jgi:hypothetical protein
MKTLRQPVAVGKKEGMPSDLAMAFTKSAHGTGSSMLGASAAMHGMLDQFYGMLDQISERRVLIHFAFK